MGTAVHLKELKANLIGIWPMHTPCPQNMMVTWGNFEGV